MKAPSVNAWGWIFAYHWTLASKTGKIRRVWQESVISQAKTTDSCGGFLLRGDGMFRLNIGSSGNYCDGIDRRSFLSLGVAGMASVGLPQLLHAREQSRTGQTRNT